MPHMKVNTEFKVVWITLGFRVACHHTGQTSLFLVHSLLWLDVTTAIRIARAVKS